MARCVVVDESNGSMVVEPEGTTCYDTQLVLVTQVEWQQNTASPFRLSLSDGAAVAAAILLTWAAAYGAKAAARALSSGNPEHD